MIKFGLALDENAVYEERKSDGAEKNNVLAKVRALPDAPSVSALAEAVSSFPRSVLVLDGITVLNDRATAEACDLKFFIELERSELLRRRTRRTYDPPDVPGYAEKIVWPFYESNLAEVRNAWNDVVYLDGGRWRVEEIAKKIVLEIVKLG
jgi:uridine kinase